MHTSSEEKHIIMNGVSNIRKLFHKSHEWITFLGIKSLGFLLICTDFSKWNSTFDPKVKFYGFLYWSYAKVNFKTKK